LKKPLLVNRLAESHEMVLNDLPNVPQPAIEDLLLRHPEGSEVRLAFLHAFLHSVLDAMRPNDLIEVINEDLLRSRSSVR
jgi:hypothetical protein